MNHLLWIIAKLRSNYTRMKYKYLFTCCLLLFLTGGLFAQSYFGIYTGINSGKLSGDSPGRFKYSSGLNLAAGLSLDIQLKEDVYLVFQPSYVNASSKLQHPKEIDEKEVYQDSISFDFKHIALPILMKLISDSKKFQFSGGFELIFPVKFIADNSAEKIDLMDDINKVNLNMLFGIGYRIPINNNLLNINLTYSQGLTNLANNLDDPDSLMPRIRYTSFRLTVAWYLPIGKK